VANGFLGAEWWVQSRSSASPKEYHMDTALTWCRNHWPKEFTLACSFYPAVGSAFYLNDEGGPTGRRSQLLYSAALITDGCVIRCCFQKHSILLFLRCAHVHHKHVLRFALTLTLPPSLRFNFPLRCLSIPDSGFQSKP
jgi:hypothetical protein